MTVNFQRNTGNNQYNQRNNANLSNNLKEDLKRGFGFIVESLSRSQDPQNLEEIDQEQLLETVEDEFLDYDHAVSTYFSIASIPAQQYGLYRPGKIPKDQMDRDSVEMYFEGPNIAVLRKDSEMTEYCQELEIDKDRLCRTLDNASKELLQEYVIGDETYQ